MAEIETTDKISNSEAPHPEALALTAQGVCSQFLGGCHTSTLWRLRKKDDSFPAPFDLSGRPLWHRADVQAWYDSKRTAQAEAA